MVFKKIFCVTSKDAGPDPVQPSTGGKPLLPASGSQKCHEVLVVLVERAYCLH